MNIPLPNSEEYPTVYPYDIMAGQLLNSALPTWHPDLLERSRTVNASGEVIRRTEKWKCKDKKTREWTWNISIVGTTTTYSPPVVEVVE